MKKIVTRISIFLFIVSFCFSNNEQRKIGLVLSGGGIKGFSALGVLQAIFDRNHMNVNTFIGTSVGSIISYLLCIGYTPIEIMITLSQPTLLEQLSIFNIANILTGINGVTKWNLIHEFLEKCVL